MAKEDDALNERVQDASAVGALAADVTKGLLNKAAMLAFYDRVYVAVMSRVRPHDDDAEASALWADAAAREAVARRRAYVEQLFGQDADSAPSEPSGGG